LDVSCKAETCRLAQLSKRESCGARERTCGIQTRHRSGKFQSQGSGHSSAFFILPHVSLQDLTPDLLVTSFTVYPATGRYYCYGCGKRGDVISFIREKEGLNFNQALDALDRSQNESSGE
jgi:CHC2 zinc finger